VTKIDYHGLNFNVIVTDEDRARVSIIEDWFASHECCFDTPPRQTSAARCQESSTVRLSPQPCSSKKLILNGVFKVYEFYIIIATSRNLLISKSLQSHQLIWYAKLKIIFTCIHFVSFPKDEPKIHN
jgi:hypothetical protein